MAIRYPVKKISLFGSYADGTANESSDVDLLIEFNTPDISLFTLLGIKNAMEDELKTAVDIIHVPLPEGALIIPDKVIDIYEQ